MMSFDGRVALITGGARGIGESYARLLAARGATVVINDLGPDVDGGSSADEQAAQSLADEIVAAGGKAVPHFGDVGSPEDSAGLVDATVDRFGSLDVLINNAGLFSEDDLPNVALDDLMRHLRVHVTGALNVTMAAWPHMEENGYGRIVMTTSTGVFGSASALCYGIAKAGVIGLARGLAVAGAPHGIRVNLIAPHASTRMWGVEPDGDGDPRARQGLRQNDPAHVAPLVAYLAHESCPVNGEAFLAGTGRASRIFIAETAGWTSSAYAEHSIEDIAENWNQIMDPDHFSIPESLGSWSLRHRQLAGNRAAPGPR